MNKRRYDLLRSKFNEFFLPTLFTSMANNTCLFADSLIVSFLIGAINLSAIQLVSPIVNLVNLVYWMVGLGGSVLTSVAKAEYNEKQSNFYFTVSIISLVLFGIAVAVFGFIFQDSIIHILCYKPGLLPRVGSFFKILVLGMPFLCYMMSLSYFIRVDGIPDLPFRAILLSNIINIIMDFVYIGFFGLGVGGAALATTTGYIIGSIYITTYFFKDERTLKFISKSKIKISKFFRDLKEICISGFPSSSTQLFILLKVFIINLLILSVIGESGLIGFAACNNISFIIYMFLIGTSQTMSPIVSVYNQEEDYSGVEYTMKRSLKFVLISSVIISAIFIIFPQVALFIFSVHNPADIPVVTEAIRYYSFSFIGLSVTFLMMFYTQAIKKNAFSLSISLIEGLIVPVVGAFLLIPLIGSIGIWVAFILAEVIAIIYIFIYSKIVEKKSNGEYSGFFMIKKQDKENVIDLSVNSDVKDIVKSTAEIQNYLKSKDISDLTSTRVSLALEEMLVNIVNINDDAGIIDVLIKIQSDHILISVKDQGIEFNPTIKRDGYEYNNIDVLNGIADKVDYARVLGLNSTVITIGR